MFSSVILIFLYIENSTFRFMILSFSSIIYPARNLKQISLCNRTFNIIYHDFRKGIHFLFCIHVTVILSRSHSQLFVSHSMAPQKGRLLPSKPFSCFKNFLSPLFQKKMTAFCLSAEPNRRQSFPFYGKMIYLLLSDIFCSFISFFRAADVKSSHDVLMIRDYKI